MIWIDIAYLCIGVVFAIASRLIYKWLWEKNT